MSNWNASKHLWLNSFGSQSAVREISCGIDHTYLLIYAIEEIQFWDSQGGWLLSLPFRKNKISVCFIQNISDFDTINLSLDPHWPGCPKTNFGGVRIPHVWYGGMFIHILWCSHNSPKSNKNCTILSPRRIPQPEKWPLWEGSLKSQHLGPRLRGGCMKLWFRRS